MSKNKTQWKDPKVSRRNFLLGATAGTAAAGLGLYSLMPKHPDKADFYPADLPKITPKNIKYNDFADVYRERWKWDKVVKGTHTRANCVSACSWNVFVKDGIAWREEQNAIYEAPRPDVPDLNPRGCQKGACYTALQLSESRVTHPLKRVGERGEGRWKRISWDEALTEIADKLIDAAIDQGSESLIFDHGTTNSGYGPETAGDMRFAAAMKATMIDSWAGVGDMPNGVCQTWGMYNCEGTSDDWFRSDFIVIWVGNPIYTRIPEMHNMHEAQYRGAKLVVIAPDLNPSTAHADMWLKINPETDAALGLAAAQVMISENLFKHDYVVEQTDLPFLVRKDTQRFLRESEVKKGGAENALYFWDEATKKAVIAPGCEGDGDEGRSLKLGNLKPALSGTRQIKLADGSTVECFTVYDKLVAQLNSEYTPEQASAITGINPKLIRRFAREMAAAPNAMIYASWGACKHYHSDLFQRAMILLMTLTGQQGKAGSGMRVAAWWGFDGMDAMMADIGLSTEDQLSLIPKAIRGLTPRDFENIYNKISYNEANTPLMPFLYMHAGYKEMWDKPHLQDPALPRGMAEYMKESIEKGWIPIHPEPGYKPKAFIFTGCNPLRRWPSPQIAREKWWPTLDLVVSVNFRMSTSSMYADYFLPVAAYYEKVGIKYGQSYVHYIITSDKATEPLGESKSDWEVFGRLSKAVQERAIARNVAPVRGFKGKPHDLKTVYDHHTGNGEYDPTQPDDPLKLMDKLFANSPSVAANTAREALDMGAVPIIGPARPSLIYQNYTDYDPNDTHWPHRDFIEKKVAWPTVTGRQQFFIDHPWYLEAGESLPVHKEPPHASSKYPLRINGGHNRWSIHAIWRDLKLLLRLQRGVPACFLNPKEAEKRGISDGDTVKVFNDHGNFEAMVKVSAITAPGELIIYHAWEPYQFKDWKGQQEPVEAPWKALHLAGGYGQVHYRMYYNAPSHAPRGAPCDVVKVSSLVEA
jgi:DMSO reductase family type II enzyme molybdopterin subunit